jgi:dTDP-L-rhamnose 4-epimerase
MSERILITGGAGFIGSHLADELLQAGYEVRVLDNLCPQVHGEARRPPPYLSTEVEFIQADVRDSDPLAAALREVSAVFHLAAVVGVGQSMYDVQNYTSVNCQGTATLLQALIQHPVRRLIVASSMSVYGEGLYRDEAGNLYENARRDIDQLRRGRWEVRSPAGAALGPVPTTETKRPDIASIYALGKYDQEQMSLIIGRAYGIDTIALRFFNVYGPRQALSNPYTGVLAIFASRFLNGKPPMVFEDGFQKRDFVHVYDVARACRLALEQTSVTQEIINIGSGRSVTIQEIAAGMAAALGQEHIQPVVTGKHRVGDIRHCFADISKARRLLSYEPQISLEEGFVELAQWLSDQTAPDGVEQANRELEKRGLTL